VRLTPPLALRLPDEARDGHCGRTLRPSELDTSLQGDRDQFLHLTYQTRPHRFYVRPLRELKKIAPDSDTGEPGWFILVYRDMTGAHAVATRAIVLALMYAVSGALALGMMALLIMRYVSGKLYEGRTAAWLWPAQRGAETYRELVFWSAALLGGGMAAIAFADGPALVILSLSLPPLVGGLWIGIQLRNRRDGQTPSPSRGPLQWAAGALFVLCFAVPLASGFFKFFWNDEIGRFQYAQALDAFESRQELISAARRDARCHPGVVCPQVESPTSYSLAPQRPTSFRDDGQLASFLSGWMPIQDSVVARIRDSASTRLGRGAPGGGALSLYSLLVLPAVILAWFWVKVQSQWILLDELAQPAALAPQAQLARAMTADGYTIAQVTPTIPPDFESWWGRSSDESKRNTVHLEYARHEKLSCRRGARTHACRVETHLDARAARTEICDGSGTGVEMSLDAARTSAYATPAPVYLSEQY